MSFREVTMYQVVCDAPNCGVCTPDLNGEYHAWSETEGAQADWDDSNALSTDDGKHYCNKHVAWCSECENEEIPHHDGAPEKCAGCLGGKP